MKTIFSLRPASRALLAVFVSALRPTPCALRLLFVLALSLAPCAPRLGATPIVYSAQTFGLAARTNRVVLTPYPAANNIITVGTNFAMGTVELFPTNNGSGTAVAYTTIVPNQYKMLIDGFTTGVIVIIPDTNVLVNLSTVATNVGPFVPNLNANYLLKVDATDLPGLLSAKVAGTGGISITTVTQSGSKVLLWSSAPVTAYVTNLTGIVDPTNLPTWNAYLISNQTWPGRQQFTNPSNTYSGNGGSLTGIAAGNIVGVLTNPTTGNAATSTSAGNAATASSATNLDPVLATAGNLTLTGAVNYAAGSRVIVSKKTVSSVANGNNTINLGTNIWTVISGPTTAFTNCSFITEGNTEGDMRTLEYNGAQNWAFANESGFDGTAANRIYTLTGGAVAGSGPFTATFRYTASRWHIADLYPPSPGGAYVATGGGTGTNNNFFSVTLSAISGGNSGSFIPHISTESQVGGGILLDGFPFSQLFTNGWQSNIQGANPGVGLALQGSAFLSSAYIYSEGQWNAGTALSVGTPWFGTGEYSESLLFDVCQDNTYYDGLMKSPNDATVFRYYYYGPTGTNQPTANHGAVAIVSVPDAPSGINRDAMTFAQNFTDASLRTTLWDFGGSASGNLSYSYDAIKSGGSKPILEYTRYLTNNSKASLVFYNPTNPSVAALTFTNNQAAFNVTITGNGVGLTNLNEGDPVSITNVDNFTTGTGYITVSNTFPSSGDYLVEVHNAAGGNFDYGSVVDGNGVDHPICRGTDSEGTLVWHLNYASTLRVTNSGGDEFHLKVYRRAK